MIKKKKTTEKTSKAAPEKKSKVELIKRLAKSYPIIGALNLEGLPAAQFQKMKAQLRGKIELVMARKTLLERGLKESGLQGVEQLTAYFKGVPALLFTKENPFALFKTIKKSRTPAPAKPGQIAPKDIILPAGPTPFAPGPIISEFAALGVKAGVEGGKVAIKSDTVVAKEGQPISEKLASMLQRLGIEPIEVGLDLTAAYENGTVFPRSVLDVDETQILQNVVTAASNAINLAVEITYTTKDTVELLLSKAHAQAKNLAREANIITSETTTELLAKAAAQAQEVAKIAKQN